MADHARRSKINRERNSVRSSEDARTRTRARKTEPEPKKANLTFTVEDDFRWEMKAWCVRHHRSMVDALREAFELLKRKYES